MGFLRKITGHTSAAHEAGTGYGTWINPERPDRSEKAVAMHLPHRYRGGLIMLIRSRAAGQPGSVVRIKGIGMTGDQTPIYTAWLPDGQRMDLPESDLVDPDEPALRDALSGAGPSAPPAGWSHLYDVLRTGYVWLTADIRNWGERSHEEWLFGAYGLGPNSNQYADVPSSPLNVFTDLDRAEHFHAEHRIKAVAARVPFVVACRLAQTFGDSDGIWFNEGSVPFGALGRDTYRFIPESVVGYDITLRPIPPQGLDPDLIGPLREALTTQPEVTAGYAWRVAAPMDSELYGAELDCLGLTLNTGNDEAEFDRVRAEIRDKAIAQGLPTNRIYAVAAVEPDSAHARDDVNVVRLKAS
jgi:hypothetical protein